MPCRGLLRTPCAGYCIGTYSPHAANRTELALAIWRALDVHVMVGRKKKRVGQGVPAGPAGPVTHGTAAVMSGKSGAAGVSSGARADGATWGPRGATLGRHVEFLANETVTSSVHSMLNLTTLGSLGSLVSLDPLEGSGPALDFSARQALEVQW